MIRVRLTPEGSFEAFHKGYCYCKALHNMEALMIRRRTALGCLTRKPED